MSPHILDGFRRFIDETIRMRQEFLALSNQVRYASSSDLSRADLEAWISTVSTLLRKAERVRL